MDTDGKGLCSHGGVQYINTDNGKENKKIKLGDVTVPGGYFRWGNQKSLSGPAPERANYLNVWGKNTPGRGESKGPNGVNQLKNVPREERRAVWLKRRT